MRLTLRTLLAYLDDTLEPSQAREIGVKVGESQVAQELIDRIKKVTRRRGLTIPPATGPDRIEANVVGEYLDNDLPGEKVAEVEEHALGSDVVLAEIAACHQILALVLGEPAQVPPTARQRMYQLVKGRESIPNRRATRRGPPTYPGEAAAAEDLKESRRGLWYRLVGALILGIALGVALWQALAHVWNRPPASTQPGPDVTTNTSTPSTDATSATKAADQDKAGTNKPADADAVPPIKPADQDKAATPKPAEPPPIAPPSAERKDVGKFVSPDKALLRRDRDAETWARVAPEARVGTGTALISLPGSASEVRLDSGASLTLWGNLPDLVNWPVLDTKVTLHVPPEGYDADFTLDRGRVYVATTKKDGPTKARARFAGQAWDVVLPDDKAEVLVEAVANYAGEPFRRDGTGEPPVTLATAGVVKGKATVTALGNEVALEAPPGPGKDPTDAALSWDSRSGLRKQPLQLREVQPFWVKAPARMPVERQRALETAQRKLLQRLTGDAKAVDLALAEMAEDSATASKVLGTFCRGALDMLPPLLDALEEANLPELRQAAVYSLQHFIARAPSNGAQVFALLQEKKGYSESQAETALRLLHGYAEPALSDPATYQAVIAELSSDRIGLRELAAWRLAQPLDPDGAARIHFRAGDPAMNRDRAIADWKRRIPEGKLPPARNGAQGRAPRQRRREDSKASGGVHPRRLIS